MRFTANGGEWVGWQRPIPAGCACGTRDSWRALRMVQVGNSARGLCDARLRRPLLAAPACQLCPSQPPPQPHPTLPTQLGRLRGPLLHHHAHEKGRERQGDVCARWAGSSRCACCRCGSGQCGQSGRAPVWLLTNGMEWRRHVVAFERRATGAAAGAATLLSIPPAQRLQASATRLPGTGTEAQRHWFSLAW